MPGRIVVMWSTVLLCADVWNVRCNLGYVSSGSNREPG